MDSNIFQHIGKRLFLALFAFTATYFIINGSIQIYGSLLDLLRNGQPNVMTPNVGCNASIHLCNQNASEYGMRQSLFSDFYAGPCTQCNPEVTPIVFILQLLILLIPALFVFWKSGKQAKPKMFKPHIRFLMAILFLICFTYSFLHLSHVFFGP